MLWVQNLGRRSGISIALVLIMALATALIGYQIVIADATPGASYSGPLGGTGRISFTVSGNGASISNIKFEWTGIAGCSGGGRVVSTASSRDYAVANNAFSGTIEVTGTNISFSGSFSSDGSAHGSVTARYTGDVNCNYGTLEWTARPDIAPPTTPSTPRTATPSPSPVPIVPVWINYLTYGSVGGGFYWDPMSGLVWTAERAWHLFSPANPTHTGPLWANHLGYGSAGGGFYWDPISGLVWTAERGWHIYSPAGPMPPPPTPAPTATPTRTPTPTPTPAQEEYIKAGEKINAVTLTEPLSNTCFFQTVNPLGRVDLTFTESYPNDGKIVRGELMKARLDSGTYSVESPVIHAEYPDLSFATGVIRGPYLGGIVVGVHFTSPTTLVVTSLEEHYPECTIKWR